MRALDGLGVSEWSPTPEQVERKSTTLGSGGVRRWTLIGQPPDTPVVEFEPPQPDEFCDEGESILELVEVPAGTVPVFLTRDHLLALSGEWHLMGPRMQADRLEAERILDAALKESGE